MDKRKLGGEKRNETNDFVWTKEEGCLEEEEDHLRRTMVAVEFMTSTRACNRIETIMEFLHERRRKDGDEARSTTWRGRGEKFDSLVTKQAGPICSLNFFESVWIEFAQANHPWTTSSMKFLPPLSRAHSLLSPVSSTIHKNIRFYSRCKSVLLPSLGLQ